MHFIQKYKDYISLFLIYFLSHIFLLLNYDGLYWDDYVLYDQSFITIKSMFAQATGGLDTATYIHTSLLYFEDGILLYRLLVFTLYFLSAIFIFKILKSLKLLDNSIVYFITLTYLVVPLMSAKIALIDFPYTLYLFIYFLAFFILSKYMDNTHTRINKLFLRIVILFLFYLSFMIPSFLVFYIFILFYLMYKEWNKHNNNLYQCVKNLLYKYSDFLLLPIISFYIKSVYFKPYGLYASYNHLQINMYTWTLLKESFNSSFIIPIYNSLNDILDYWYISLVIIFFLYKFIKTFIFKEEKLSFLILLLLVGVFMFTVAVFPYIAVLKLPQLSGWESRHQLLIPLGFSFIVVSLYLSIRKFYIPIANILLSTILTGLIITTYDNYLKYERDWFYQLALEKNIKENKMIQQNSTFIVTLENQSYLANNRNISFYEFGGHSKKVFGIDNKLFVESLNDIKNYLQYKKHKQYNFSHWEYENPIYLKISFNKIFPIEMYRLTYLYLFDRNRFELYIEKYVTILEGKG